MASVVCIGSSVVDLQLYGVDSFPKGGNLKIVNYVLTNTGGCGLNVAFNLSTLGIKPILITKLGKDLFGEWILDKCKKAGIDTSRVSYADHMTSCSSILIASCGERSILHYPGANNCLRTEDIDLSIFSKADYLCVVGVFGLGEFDNNLKDFLKQVKTHNPNVKILVDVIYSDDIGCSSIIDSALKYVDFFTPNYEEAKKLSNMVELKDIADYFLEKGVSNIIITLGDKGAYLGNSNTSRIIDSIPAVAVDTTGAGDAFVAGFIAAHSKGLPITECVKFANCTGAMSVQAVGAVNGVKSYEEIWEQMLA